MSSIENKDPLSCRGVDEDIQPMGQTIVLSSILIKCVAGLTKKWGVFCVLHIQHSGCSSRDGGVNVIYCIVSFAGLNTVQF